MSLTPAALHASQRLAAHAANAARPLCPSAVVQHQVSITGYGASQAPQPIVGTWAKQGDKAVVQSQQAVQVWHHANSEYGSGAVTLQSHMRTLQHTVWKQAASSCPSSRRT